MSATKPRKNDSKSKLRQLIVLAATGEERAEALGRRARLAKARSKEVRNGIQESTSRGTSAIGSRLSAFGFPCPLPSLLQLPEMRINSMPSCFPRLREYFLSLLLFQCSWTPTLFGPSRSLPAAYLVLEGGWSSSAASCR
jgi:hypothetical protein